MAQARILVVEDDPLTAELVRQCLEHEGFAVEVAHDGLGASRALGSERPDLVLLDLVLPDLDGWELCALIRTLPDPGLSDVPIVMLTSRSSPEDRLRGLRAGADDYITKPFSVEELVLKVRRLLSRRGAPRASEGEGGVEDLYDMLHHELKNHLVAISGFARRVDLQADTISRETLKRYVGFIRKSAEHLSGFVEDVLWFRRIQEGRLEVELEPVDLQEVARDVLSLAAAPARERRLELRRELAPDTPPVRFHPAAAKLCLSNLVENAVKYTPEGGVVAVRLRPDKGAGAVFEVEDTGPGIPGEDRERVFEKFYRGRTAERSTKGTGLGLYVVRSLAQALGAGLSLEAAPGGGSLFRLTFPAASPQEPS